MTTSTTSRSRRTWYFWVPIAVIGALVVLVFVQRDSGRRRLKAAVDRIARDGQALTPAYLAVPKNADKSDPTEWLARVSRSRPAWDMSDVSDPDKYAFLLDEARANRLGEDARIAFESFDLVLKKHLEGAADPKTRTSELWIALAVRLRECDGVRPWGEWNEAAVRLLAVGLAEQMKLARQAERYGLIDPVREAASLESGNEAFPRLPILQEAGLGDAIHVTAVHKAQAGYAAEALESLRAGLAMAHVHSAPSWIMSEVLWALHWMRVLDGLQTILPMLPRGLDLSDFENALASVRPREVTALAIRGERAFGFRVLTLVDEGGIPAGASMLSPSSVYDRLKRFLVSDFDRAAYLEAMTDAAVRAEKSRYLRLPAVDGVPSSFWTPAAAIITPQLEPTLLTSDQFEARVLLARIALVAYRAGAKDALELLAKTTDPFDGQPIRCGFAEGGLVVFWSAGPDGKDDGALPDTDDIVWGLKLSE